MRYFVKNRVNGWIDYALFMALKDANGGNAVVRMGEKP